VYDEKPSLSAWMADFWLQGTGLLHKVRNIFILLLILIHLFYANIDQTDKHYFSDEHAHEHDYTIKELLNDYRIIKWLYNSFNYTT